jgi:Mg/Co/Ni transporter MgtE
VHEALARVRAGRGESTVVLVAGELDRLLGVVELAELVRAAESATLAALLRPPAATLLAAAPLASAVGHRAWETANAVPVLARGDRLLGVLRQQTLARAMTRAAGLRAEDQGAGLAQSVARSYWEALSAVLTSTVELLPAAPKIGAVGDGR